MGESINERLEKLYKKNWDILTEELNKVNSIETNKLKATNPLLIKIDENEYNKSDIKVMIFGQETNTWDGLYNNNYDKILKKYETFFNNDRCFKYGGQFWNGIKKFKNKLQQKYKGKEIYLVWNNICKIGNAQRNKNRTANYILEIEEKYFNVINEEIDILRPNVIIYFTGPNYDEILKSRVNEFSFEEVEGYNLRQLVKLKNDKVKNVFRTYHPNFLYRGKNRIENYFNTILENIEVE